MDLVTRLHAFSELGKNLVKIIMPLADQCLKANPWFTPSEIRRAAENWAESLAFENLGGWCSRYPISKLEPLRTVFVVTAGNIPMVGFHDFLSVLITGNKIQGKLSSKDPYILPALASELIRIENGFENRISFETGEANPSAVIATGSGNTGRFFRRDYRSYPTIIRSNQTSVAIIDQSMSDDDFDGIAADILEYYGLGCRSISHVLVQNQDQFDHLVRALKRSHIVDQCFMLNDNLKFQRARLQLGGVHFLDGGSVLLSESHLLFSPVGIVNYSYYSRREEVEQFLLQHHDSLQCIIGTGHTKPGFAQRPTLWDYADQVDTIDFLLNLRTDA